MQSQLQTPNQGDMMMPSLQRPPQNVFNQPNSMFNQPQQHQQQITNNPNQFGQPMQPPTLLPPNQQQFQNPSPSAFQRPPPLNLSQPVNQGLNQQQPPTNLNNPLQLPPTLTNPTSLIKPPTSLAPQTLNGPPMSIPQIGQQYMQPQPTQPTQQDLTQQISNLSLNQAPPQPNQYPASQPGLMNRNESPSFYQQPNQPNLYQPPQLQPTMPGPPLQRPQLNQPQLTQPPMTQPGQFQPPPMNQNPYGLNPQIPNQGFNRPPSGPYPGPPSNMPPGPPTAGNLQGPPPMGMNGQQVYNQPGQMMRPPGPYQPGQPMQPGQQMPPVPGGGFPGMQPSYDQQPQQQQQQKMDLDQIPNPIEVMQANNAKYGGEFETNEAGKIPPLTLTDFTCKDMGNCNPRFIRSSMYSVPNNGDLLKQSKLPLVLNLTPFAELKNEEREPPITDLGELGPVRCKRCKAYMSPFMTFIDNGKKFQCPFCEDVTQVPQEYFNHLDHMGKRVDMYERAELCCGSYEFVATKDYCRQQVLPQPPSFIFMIDVSINSVRSGLLHVLCPYIKNVILPNLPRDVANLNSTSEIRVGFVTYDKELHFYNLNGSLAAPQMMIVSDIEEVFVPILDGFLVKLSESKSVIENLLDSLPSMFQNNKETELILGPVVEAGIEALKSAKSCGKLFIFHTNIPNSLAPGQLKSRDDKKLLGTDKEKMLLSPQTDYYAQLGKKCVENGCTVDLFLLPNQYCDVATLSDLTRKTSGQIYKYDFFMADSHGQRLCEDLKYSIDTSCAFDAVMKVRTSTGIKPLDYLGNISMYGNDVELAGLHKQTSLAVELKHEDKLNENSKVFIQMALLYTSLSGQRRIRIHNLSLSVCTQYSQLYSSCELDTLINYMAKLACRSITVSTPKSIRENLIQQVSHILATYRKNCTNSPAKGQFILPETLKLLPVFSNSLLKSDAITGAQSVTTDERAWLMYRLMSMDVQSTYSLFYPRVLQLDDLETPTPLPQPTRCIYERLKDDGIYLLENGLVMYLWIGSNVPSSTIQNLFGVAAIQQLNVEKAKLLEIDTPISINVRSVINQVNEQRKSHLKLIVVRKSDSLEVFFRNLLVEDKGLAQTSLSYVEYLYHLHREIKNILS